VTDLAWMDAIDLAAMVRRREVTPRELVEAALARIDAVDPAINAVVTRFDDLALRAADTVEDRGQPFFGVPYLLKESASMAGVRASSASALLRDRVADSDSELVRRYREAGLIPVGKANMSEFGILGTTEPSLFGPTRNPWDPTRTPGGSSGGSAAAVAAGLVPIAHGGDSGGSIRIPASCCGIVGLKPSRGRNPMPPGADVGGLTAQHVLARTVRDCAALLDATAGPYGGGPWVPPPQETFAAAVERGSTRLRIAFSAESPLGFPVHPDCVAAVQDAAALCASLGHVVNEGGPDLDGERLFETFDLIWTSELASWISSATKEGELDRLLVEPLSWAIVEVGRSRSAADYQRGLVGAQVAAAAAASFHERYDVWLTPTLGAPPVVLGWLAQPPDDPLRAYRRDAEFCAFTPVANMTGQPAISLPLFWNAEGLPIGVQCTAAFGAEEALLDLAGQLERARPWAGLRPPIRVDAADV
jgi:amidase